MDKTRAAYKRVIELIKSKQAELNDAGSKDGGCIYMEGLYEGIHEIRCEIEIWMEEAKRDGEK